MALNINNKKPALFAVLMLAVMGNLSHLPGMKDAVQSMDLQSNGPLYLNNCPVEEEVGAGGASSCRVVNANKIAANVSITKVTVQVPGNSPAPETVGPATQRTVERYKVVSSLEADFCADGTCVMERTVTTLAEAIKLGQEFAEKLSKDAKARIAEEKERQAKIDSCETDDEGKEIKREDKKLKCLIRRLKSLSGEEKEDFYAEHLKERIQGLLQSTSASERALGMGALGELGKELNINCTARPGLPQNNNALLNHQNLSPFMNPMRPVSTAGTRPGAERNLISESACDMWAFGTYNNNLDYLQLAASQGANRQQVAQAINTLKSGWGNYFRQRGLALQADPLGLNGMSTDVYNDVLQNNATLDANFKAILEKYKEYLNPNGTNPDTSAGAAGQGRMARGGIVPQNPVGPGSAVNPWVGSNGQATPARPPMVPSQQTGKYSGAPKFGTPVR